ncbi:hypothetical protein CR159_08190 [Pollutimonas subterranea]|uniref:Zinc finger/thioredoxin putative domain-containing protein n=1 Tax=Pollutimonas subterranea TaxID=2045210 RepID=A0A2N4U5X2_9BURK|nr:zinc-ribbon and DUF3426 domain-containing protein [Pollutimonas subterranea]PLC50422.1 hypothetical protein CR159_08190 [Pollutimonas subterranea]
MDLTTRCPQCGTVFTATLEQLQLRKGYIRCVSCAHIFDGYDAVVPGSEIPPATPPVAAPIAPAADATTSMPSVLRQRQGKKEPVFGTGSTPDSEPPRKPPSDPTRPAFSISNTRQISQESSRQDPVFRVDDRDPDPEGSDPVVVRGRRPEPVLGRERDSIAPPGPLIAKPRQNALPSTGTQQSVPKIYVEPRAPATTGDPRQAHDIPDIEAPRYRGIASVFWSVLIVAGLVLLLAQLAYVYRVQLAQHIPAVRPLLMQACAQLACEVPYSRQINQISIMSSSLRATAGAAASSGGAASGTAPAADAAAGAAPAAATPAGDPTDSMTLQLTLRNTYDKPQEWPTLVLDLTDFSGTLVVRKNLPPSSYLTPDLLQQPFAASSEITVGVPIVLNGLKVNGYQLGKFFP